MMMVERMSRELLRVRVTGCCASGHGGGDAGYGGDGRLVMENSF